MAPRSRRCCRRRCPRSEIARSSSVHPERSRAAAESNGCSTRPSRGPTSSRVPTPELVSFYVYMLECGDGSLYPGQTDALEKGLWELEHAEVPGSVKKRM